MKGEGTKGRAYMRDDDFAPHQHQIIHPHPRPFPATVRPLASPTDAQLRADFPAPVQQQPNVIALLDLARAARDVGAVVEDEGHKDLGRFDGVLHREELLAQLLPCLDFAQEGRFRQDFGCDAHGRVGAQPSLLNDRAGGGVEDGWGRRS